MALEYDHDEIVQTLALTIEKDKRYALVKFFVPWGDQKTDLIGTFYPDITCLRREGKTKLMIEVLTPYSFEDPDELRRLEGLSDYCASNAWEFYLACPDERTLELTKKKIEGRAIRPRSVWSVSNAPFEADPAQMPAVQ
jgi:hypothetical protein